jgi:hypothetical protein
VRNGRQHMQQRIVAGILVAVMLAGSAPAGEIADKAAQAESLAADGKYVAALDALDEAAASLWSKSPLTFRKFLWVASDPSNFGEYDPRQTNVYKAGDKMIAYGEPVGYDWQRIGDNWWRNLHWTVTFKTKDGKKVPVDTGSDFFQDLKGSRTRIRDIMMVFTFALTGVPAGEYIVDITLRDVVSGKSGVFSPPFVLR